ncbi:MAG: hypothetical protein AB1772_11620 [Candidatus Zixiibacteriota bacterium]
MNTGKYVVGSLAVFVYIFLAEFVFHGLIMENLYSPHLHLLRPEAEMYAYMIWMILGYLVMAFGFCFIFIKGYENKGIAEGFRYGLYIAVAFAWPTSLVEYAVYPFPGSWIVGWIIGYPIMMIIAGMIFAAIYKPKAAAAA